MRYTFRSTLLTLAVLALTLLTAGCTISYKFNGSAINYDIYKTIDIGEFPIRAALVYPPLQQTCLLKNHTHPP